MKLIFSKRSLCQIRLTITNLLNLYYLQIKITQLYNIRYYKVYIYIRKEGERERENEFFAESRSETRNPLFAEQLLVLIIHISFSNISVSFL